MFFFPDVDVKLFFCRSGREKNNNKKRRLYVIKRVDFTMYYVLLWNGLTLLNISNTFFYVINKHVKKTTCCSTNGNLQLESQYVLPQTLKNNECEKMHAHIVIFLKIIYIILILQKKTKSFFLSILYIMTKWLIRVLRDLRHSFLSKNNINSKDFYNSLWHIFLNHLLRKAHVGTFFFVNNRKQPRRQFFYDRYICINVSRQYESFSLIRIISYFQNNMYNKFVIHFQGIY